MAEPFPAFLAAHRPALEDALRAALADGPAPLITAARYVMGWEDARGHPTQPTGKRIRPLLALAAAEALGADRDAAMPGAVAVELVHNFSLVHDDVQDRDRERRGRPSAWALHGEGQAINLGDFLFARGCAALLTAPGPAERRAAALEVLLRAAQRMIAGQWADIAFEAEPAIPLDAYRAMVAGKTGALMGAPLEIGALLAGASADTASAFGEWGLQLGLAFQVQDDYLGTWGDPARTGKSDASDIARKKKTFPVVYGLAHPAAHDAVVAAYARDALGPADVTAVRQALEAAGADAACRGQALEHLTAAEAVLAHLRLGEEAREQLSAVARFLADRDS